MKTNNATTAPNQPRTNILVIVAGIVIALIGSLVVFQSVDAKYQNHTETFANETGFGSVSSAVFNPKLEAVATTVVRILSAK